MLVVTDQVFPQEVRPVTWPYIHTAVPHVRRQRPSGPVLKGSIGQRQQGCVVSLLVNYWVWFNFIQGAQNTVFFVVAFLMYTDIQCT